MQLFVINFSQGKNIREEKERSSFEISKKLDNGSSSDAQGKPNGKTNKIIIQLSQRLRTATIDIETVTLKNKQLVKQIRMLFFKTSIQISYYIF